MVVLHPQVDGRMLGCWLYQPVEQSHYSVELWKKTYFDLPPYFSFLEYMATDFSVWSTKMTMAGGKFQQLLTLCDQNPNIKIAVMLGQLDLTPSRITALNNFCNAMIDHKSVSSIGVETEYVGFDITVKSNWIAFRDIINFYGFPMVNYRIDKPVVGGLPVSEGFHEIGHTNFPIPSDGAWTVDWFIDPNKQVGISCGLYDSAKFPGTWSKAKGYTPSTGYDNYGWSQEALNWILDRSANQPLGVRLYTSLCPGYSTSTFNGVGGAITNELWDNPTLRTWITLNANYNSFIKSTTGTTPPPPPPPTCPTGEHYDSNLKMCVPDGSVPVTTPDGTIIGVLAGTALIIALALASKK